MNAQTQIKSFEGKRNEAYPDPLTGGAPWTIGYGHTGPEVHEGLSWSDEQVDQAFEADFEKASASLLNALPWTGLLNEPRQAVLQSMVFQMGLQGVLGFKNTLANCANGQYAATAAGLLSSRWAQQTPNRARKLAKQMETGEWVL